MSHRILIVGGAGYIGSHMTLCLQAHGLEVTVLDNLSTGSRELVHTPDLVIGDMADDNLVSGVIRSRGIAAVMHFASCINVGESVRDPGKYYENNVGKTISLLNTIVRCGIRRMIFSSTSAVYGTPERLPINEQAPLAPLNPYGESKAWVERVLAAFDHAHGLRSYSLRYFNAAGADPQGRAGECHDPETHLIPIALQVALGQREQLDILGDDYRTEDGTGVRDYVHVTDLCEAHYLALLDLFNGGAGGILNVGIGRGFTVRQVVAAVEKVTGRPVPTRIQPRRPGDTDALVADSRNIQDRLGWRPRYTDLETIVRHAWAWEKNGRRTAPAERGDT
ncbi:MAG TPA: UDP-glucose 4-epimerase GalE [Nevskiaceae bacterium]|nr:UDP-glucose 4-epimerase GalE [Nevskiaceae bacterium]